jgi:hypothetical protein
MLTQKHSTQDLLLVLCHQTGTQLACSFDFQTPYCSPLHEASRLATATSAQFTLPTELKGTFRLSPINQYKTRICPFYVDF